MGVYGGIKYVLDLEACLDFANAGENRKAALFQLAETDRVAVTTDVFKQLKIFNKDLAAEFENSAIEIVECDESVYQAAEILAQLLSVSPVKLDRAANEKLPILAVVNCAQNGSQPKCALVTGDFGDHRSSMKVLGNALMITVISVEKAF